MTKELLIGAISLAVAAVLIFIGLPRRGVSPRFLRFEAAMMLYPPLVMIFLVVGAAMVMTVLRTGFH